MTSPDSPSPRTEAGKRLLASQARYELWHPIDGRRAEETAAILAIEAEAAQEAPAPDGIDRLRAVAKAATDLIEHGEWTAGQNAYWVQTMGEGKALYIALREAVEALG